MLYIPSVDVLKDLDLLSGKTGFLGIGAGVLFGAGLLSLLNQEIISLFDRLSGKTGFLHR